jgi:hypothetical protein
VSCSATTNRFPEAGICVFEEGESALRSKANSRKSADFSAGRYVREAMRDIVLLALAVVAVLFPMSTIIARAAEISAAPPLNGVTAILIKGEIESGDARDFVRRTEGKQRVLVVLSSPGGATRDALTIAAQIRTKGFATTVADQCVSACALVWLSGVRRYLNSNARVGFHAAFVMKNGVPVETGMGNARWVPFWPI